MRILTGALFAILLAWVLPQRAAPAVVLAAAGVCEQLSSLALPGTTITSAQKVAAGAFAPPATGAPAGAPGATQAFSNLPSFCRVAAVLKPSSDSNIEMEVWLPVDNWNGKFQAVGNGGWAGTISYPAMASALREGYATASTDTGHKGGDAAFGIGHPEKIVDFAFRAVHEMAVTSKAFVSAFYDRAPRLSYWNGCSTGGRQGLMEAQKYPEDFDAVVAGAPANYQTHLHAWDLGVAVPALNDAASAVTPAKLAMLNKAVLLACDARDGVKDGVLNNPRTCNFNPETLLCRGGVSDDSCLTAPQVESVKRMYSPARTKTGEAIFPGKDPGSELGWNAISGGTQPAGVSLGSFRVAYSDSNWDWRNFDLDRDLKVVDERVGSIINAINPDLSAFKARGGKLLLYHGWNDTAISAGNAVNYYSSVLSKMGPSALERWRESGIAPDRLIASRVTDNRVETTRPLCPYPQVAVYNGAGSTNDAANFACKAP